MTELNQGLSAATVDRAELAKRVETTPVDGKFGTRLFAMSDAERDLVVRLLRSDGLAQSAREQALEAAALDFIAKVERGEARSTKSYAAFKAALDTGLPTADDVRGILAAPPPAAPVETSQIEEAMLLLGDVPGETLVERVNKLISYHLGLQAELEKERASRSSAGTGEPPPVWEQVGWLRDYDRDGEEVTEICSQDDPGAYAIYRGVPPVTEPQAPAMPKALDCMEYMPLKIRPLVDEMDEGEHWVIDADNAYVFKLCCSYDRAERVVSALNAAYSVTRPK